MRSELFSGDSGSGQVSRDCPNAGGTRIMILRRSGIDHYRCPLSFFLFGSRL